MTVDDGRPVIADWLFDHLNETEWSYRALARKIGVHPSTVGHWVAGRSIPEPPNIIKLADVFGESRDMLLALAGHRPEDAEPDEVMRERAMVWAHKLAGSSPSEIAMVDAVVNTIAEQVRRNQDGGNGLSRR